MEPGLIDLAVKDIFSIIQDTTTQVSIQYYEVYNEQVQDLLASIKKRHRIRQTGDGNFIAENVTNMSVKSCEEALDVISKADSQK